MLISLSPGILKKAEPRPTAVTKHAEPVGAFDNKALRFETTGGPGITSFRIVYTSRTNRQPRPLGFLMGKTGMLWGLVLEITSPGLTAPGLVDTEVLYAGVWNKLFGFLWGQCS